MSPCSLCLLDCKETAQFYYIRRQSKEARFEPWAPPWFEPWSEFCNSNAFATSHFFETKLYHQKIRFGLCQQMLWNTFWTSVSVESNCLYHLISFYSHVATAIGTYFTPTICELNLRLVNHNCSRSWGKLNFKNIEQHNKECNLVRAKHMVKFLWTICERSRSRRLWIFKILFVDSNFKVKIYSVITACEMISNGLGPS